MFPSRLRKRQVDNISFVCAVHAWRPQKNGTKLVTVVPLGSRPGGQGSGGQRGCLSASPLHSPRLRSPIWQPWTHEELESVKWGGSKQRCLSIKQPQFQRLSMKKKEYKISQLFLILIAC